MLIPVLLCGGSGTRLWPLSRSRYPKQFLPLTGERTMFQETVRRASAVDGAVAPIALGNADHRFLIAQQLAELGIEGADIILEPHPRNTAPAVAVAALRAIERDPDALLLVLPSDHFIADEAPYLAALAQGADVARDGRLVTFGIVPERPETGYGYIRAKGANGDAVRAVAEFVEKPDPATAAQYVRSGDYLWNSGLFLFRADAYLEELGRLRPAMLEACRAALAGAAKDLDFLRLDGDAFAACESDSIDYAVMEGTDRASVVPLDCGWSDLGSWGALQAISAPDDGGNVLIGDVFAEDTHRSYVRADSRLVATIGVEDQIIVETKDAVLVAARDRVQEVKRVVERLAALGRSEAAVHCRVYRPWGSYEGVAEAERFQVKRIIVDPGARLSLQMHHHRAEHWVVVRGTARVTSGEESFLLTEDQSTYIPLGTRHRLENPGSIPLELIEVQTGSYLGEDDIIRFDDVYGRSGSRE